MRNRRTVANVLRVLKRARKAEQIAQLKHALAESQWAIDVQNQELERGVAALTRTLQSAVSSREGDYERIHLPDSHALWPVLQQLWHFLDRWQQHRQAEALMDATIRSSTELIRHWKQANQANRSTFRCAGTRRLTASSSPW